MEGMEAKIRALAPKGVSYTWLAEKLGTSRGYVEKVVASSLREDGTMISRWDIEAFKSLVEEGDTFRARVEIYRVNTADSKSQYAGSRTDYVSIQKKYPFIAVTDKGTFSWGWLLAMILHA